jgi:hypothetical protein
MSKDRLCYNCVHYEQHSSVTGRNADSFEFAPRCTKGLNPSLAHAPSQNHLREIGGFEPDNMALFCDSYLWSPVRYPKLRRTSLIGLKRHGQQYRNHQLPEKFVPAFEKGQNYRVKVERGINMRYTEHGYVSISTGWEPVFLLMRSNRSRLSSVVLCDDDEIIGERTWDEKRYRRVKA